MANDMNAGVDFVAHVNFLWYENQYVPSRVAFSSTYDPEDTLVVMPTQESLKDFSFADVSKNIHRLPHDPFRLDKVQGKAFRVAVYDLQEFIGGEFYENVLKHPHGWEVTIGTYDMATFMYLEPLLTEGKVVYMGERTDAEQEAVRLAKNQARWTAANVGMNV